MNSPLMDLAWQFLPEKVIVARVAADVVRDYSAWTSSARYGGLPSKKVVDGYVRNTSPPRGMLGKRIEAVRQEAKRQKAIYTKRARNAPIDWANWSQPQLEFRYREVAAYRLKQNGHNCLLVRQWKGHLLMIYSNWSHLALAVRHPGGRIDVVTTGHDRTLPPKGWILQYFLAQVSQGATKEAMLGEAKLSYDFCRLRTIINRPDGSETYHHWDSKPFDQNGLHPLAPCPCWRA